MSNRGSLEEKIAGYLAEDTWSQKYEDFNEFKKSVFEKVLKDCAKSFDMELPGENGTLQFTQFANCVFNQSHLYPQLQHSRCIRE